MESLEHDVAAMLIDALQLPDMTPADIDFDAPLFGEGLGLDSIDALEIALTLQKQFGVRLSANSQETRKHFASVRTLAAFVAIAREEAAAS